MSAEWRDDQPIYKQLRDKVATAILDGVFGEGEALPSVRNVALDLQINPLTVSKAYQQLVSEELVEKRRGLGMFVIDGARAKLLRAEKRRFLDRDWPQIVARIELLELDVAVLLENVKSMKSRPNS